MSVLPRGHQWRAHDGACARLRRLRQLTHGLVVPAEHETRLQAWLQMQAPNVERVRARLVTLNMARELAASTGVSFADALGRVLSRLEWEARSALAATAPAEVA